MDKAQVGWNASRKKDVIGIQLVVHSHTQRSSMLGVVWKFETKSELENMDNIFRNQRR